MRRFLADQQGSTAVLTGGMLATLIGMLAFAVDAGHLYYNKHRLQIAADAASLGAALVLPNASRAMTRATTLAAENVPASFKKVTIDSDVILGKWDKINKTFTATSSNPNAVKVSATRSEAKGNSVRSFFAGVLGYGTTDLGATSIAYRVGPEYCVIVLDPEMKDAYSAGGGGNLNVANCGVYVNSTSLSAATTAGNASSTAQTFCVTGSYVGTFSPVPKTGCPPIADPLASLPEPAVPSGTCNNVATSGSVTLNPGCYTSLSISGSGAAKLNPGLYYIKGGNLNLLDSAGITGEGVTVFLDAGSSMNMRSSGVVSVSAPTSGTYKGILLFQSRSAPKNTENKFGGSSQFKFDGMLYTPTVSMVANGTTSVSDVQSSGYIITRRLTFTGASEFRLNRTSSGADSAGFESKVALVD